MRTRDLPQLTGVRALAASMVFLNHYSPPRELIGWFFSSFFQQMHAGVSLFFVLSGFLIYLRHSSPESLHRTQLIRYFFHRFARVYPMYFLVVVGSLAWTLAYIYPPMPSLSVIANFLLLQLSLVRGFSDEYKFMGVGQGWTLTVEATFYILFPLMLLLIRRIGFLTVLLMVYGIGMVLYSFGEVAQYHSYFIPFQFVLIFTFFGRAGDFFAGMMLADFVRRKGLLHKQAPRAEARKSKWRMPVFTLLGGIGLVGCLAVLALLDPDSPGDAKTTPAGIVLYIVAMPLMTCALFYGLITERTWFSRLMGSRLLVTMGASSYCFYLIHVGGPGYLLNAWVDVTGVLPGYLGLVAVSILLWKYVEEPLRRLILSHRLFRESSGKVPPGDRPAFS
jgi:peptidoglycan/LPS O-acetylase OafA/YrhL